MMHICISSFSFILQLYFASHCFKQYFNIAKTVYLFTVNFKKLNSGKKSLIQIHFVPKLIVLTHLLRRLITEKNYKLKSITHLFVIYGSSDNQNANKHKGTQQSTNCDCNLSITVSYDFLNILKYLLQLRSSHKQNKIFIEIQ